MSADAALPRPRKKTEFVVIVDGPRVAKGWKDCIAQVPNAMVDAWDRLTTAPETETERQYQLRDNLATKVVAGKTLPQWQYKISDGGRIRYVIDHTAVTEKGKVVAAGTVTVVAADPGHPKDTERKRGRG